MDKNIIVLNGKRYDAVSGALLDTVMPEPVAPVHHTAVPAVHRKPGTNPHLSRQQQHARSHVSHAHAAVKAEPAAPKLEHPKVSRAFHADKKAVPGNKIQPSKTLMRRAVHKPEGAAYPHTKRHYPLATKTAGGISPKISVSTVDHGRMRRSQGVAQSHKIDHFRSAAAPITIQPKVTHVPIASPPAQAAAAPAKKLDIFEKALAEATAHIEAEHKPARKHRAKKLAKQWYARPVAALIVVVVIGGAVVLLNKSTVELQVASLRAGFHASMPHYVPDGYSHSSASTEGNKIAIHFVAPSKDTAYTLTQEASDWDSQTLFDSIAANTGNGYQTVQSKGRTIYIYGQNDAAWVDGGVLYKITGDTQLSSDQVISIAGSM